MLAVGFFASLFLFWVRKWAEPALIAAGLKPRDADIAAKAGPIVAVALTILAVLAFGLESKGVKLVGAIPQGLPPFALPSPDLALIEKLWVPALLISTIGFVDSVSVRSEEHTSELQSLMRISYAVFCLQKKK